MTINPSNEVIRKTLLSTRTIAMVGASSKQERPSNGIFRYLMQAGYRVIPVNPNETTVHGQAAYPTLEAVDEPIDLVNVFRRSDQTVDAARGAVAVGARTLWLQEGISNQVAGQIARQAGLTVVMDLCIGVAHSRLRD